MKNDPVQRFSDRLRILVVDDHEASRLYAVALLSSGPGRVRHSRDARSALRQVFSWYPQVICMDLQLPDLGGLELVRKIRADWPPERQPPRIILLTGDASELSPDQMSVLGIAAVLLKPTPGHALEEAVYSAPVIRISERREKTHRSEIRELFRSELRNRLPELEKLLAAARQREVASVLHQLIASAAMSGESRLETSLRDLALACRDNLTAAELADRHFALLESADDFLSAEGPAND